METSKKLLDLLYNSKLPQIYRDEDAKIGLPLRRYLDSLVEGGYKGAIVDIEKSLSLFDPKSIPDDIFPYLCESFGIEYFPDIGLTYQRKFLSNLGELIRRRGTFSSIHFMIRALTGLDSEIVLVDDTLTITLLARSIEGISLLEHSIKAIGDYVKTQIPYYITPVINSRIDTQLVSSKSYTYGAVTYSKTYKLNTYKEVN